jgi:hypothetical protein
MNFTNKYDLPDYIFEWLVYDNYDSHEGVISATTLLGNPRKHILSQRHWDNLTVDCSDMLARRLGSAIHSSFEVINVEDIIKEKRVFTEVDGKRISGKFDMLKKVGNKHMLVDIKTTSVWKYIDKKKIEDWKDQLSIYRYILKCNDYKVSQNAEICFMFTDWKQNEVRQYKGYPPIRMWHMPIYLYGVNATEAFIQERLKIFAAYEKLPDEKIPYCNNDDLWLTKKGKANACNYCDVRCVCVQYRELLNNDLVYNADAGVINDRTQE